MSLNIVNKLLTYFSPNLVTDFVTHMTKLFKFFISPAHSYWLLWGISPMCMRTQQHILPKTTSTECPEKIKLNSTPTFLCWEKELFTKWIAKLKTKKQSKDSCQKDFPAHSKLTPGLYLLTCGCPNKSVYGFSMMTTGESPAMLFDLVMTRFETNYNPHIIYDASCLAKEYGYNRELRRFMSLTITTDRFHQCNHKSCSDSFRSTEYSSLENINTEACEQTNSALRRVSSSTTYMSPIMYMRSLTLFLADLNVSAKRKSWILNVSSST